jgi:hypothetical protein
MVRMGQQVHALNPSHGVTSFEGTAKLCESVMKQTMPPVSVCSAYIASSYK